MTDITYKLPDCACERCACIYQPDAPSTAAQSFRCSGPKENVCTADKNFGGCWNAKISSIQYHACVDNFKAYKASAATGSLTEGERYYTCTCPPCFSTMPDGTCKPNCDLQYCDANTGVCMSNIPGASAPSGAKSGMSSAGVFFFAVISVALSAGLMFGVYTYVLKQRMHTEVRDIMSQYIPLDTPESANSGSTATAGGSVLNGRQGPEPFPTGGAL